MRRRWHTLSFVHWPVPLTQVARRLPPGLAVDAFEGQAWVGLVPFATTRIRLASMLWPAVFPETNVRTYVVGPAGPGVWFDSRDISRLVPVALARSARALPYNWAQMDITRRGELVRYETSRRWPERNATSTIEVAVGREIPSPDAFEVFVSARRRLYTMVGKRLATAAISHGHLPLRAAHLTELEDQLVRAAGYRPLDLEPHVMFSTGVSAGIERLRKI